MKPSPEKDMSMTTTTEARRVKVCAHKEFASEYICGRLSGNHLMQWCPLHPGASTVEIDTPAPQPALDTGEWRVEAMPIHGYRILNENGNEIVRDIYSEEVAARIADDHTIAHTVPRLLEALHDARASAAAVPKLVAALEDMIDLWARAQKLVGSGRQRNIEGDSQVIAARKALATVQGKEQG